MSAADVAIGLTLEDDDYNQKIDRADRKMRMLGEHSFRGTQAGAKNVQKSLQDVERQAERTAKKLSMMERFTGGAERVSRGAKKVKWAAWGVAGLAEAGSLFSKFRAKRLEGMKEMNAEDEKNLAKWKRRHEVLGGVAKRAGRFGLGAAVVQHGAEGFGLLGRLFGGGKGAAETAAGFDQVARSIAGASSQGSSFGNILEGIAGWAGKIVIGLTGIGVAGGIAIGGLLASGVKLNANLEEATAQFEIFTGSAEKAKAMVAALKKDADVTPFSTEEVIATGSSLVSMADKSQKKLMELVKTAEMLTVLNPNKAAGGGLESASIALKNALSGDFTSMQDRFNIAPAQIAALKAQGLQGLQLVQKLLSSLGIAESSIEKMGRTWRGLLSTVLSFVDTLKMNFAGPFFEYIKGKAELATAWIQENSQWAINVAKGLGMWVQEKIVWAAGFLGQGKSWFNVVMNWVDLLPGKLQEAWQGSKFSAFFGDLMAKLWELGTKIAKLFFDSFLLAAEIIGRTIYGAIPKRLGGGGFNEKLEEMRKTGPMGDMAADMLQRAIGKNDSDRWQKIFAQTGGIKAAAGAVGSTVSNFVGNTLGGRQAMAQAGKGGLGILDKAAALGAGGTAANDPKAAAAAYQEKYGGFFKQRDTILGNARKAAANAPIGLQSGIMNAAYAQVESARLAAVRGPQTEGSTAPTAAGGQMSKSQVMAEKNNAKAQMRAPNLPAKVQISSMSDNFHPVTATIGGG
jgi:hypothetical protein